MYTHEIAETKVAQVIHFARHNQHPLQCTMERRTNGCADADVVRATWRISAASSALANARQH